MASDDEALSRSRTPPPQRIASSTEWDVAEAVGAGEVCDADSAEDSDTVVVRHWEEVAKLLLDPLPMGSPGYKPILHHDGFGSGVVSWRRVQGRHRWVYEEKVHYWDEMRTGVSESMRAFVVMYFLTQERLESDSVRADHSESRAIEVLQHCDVALRTHASEPPWDLLRIEFVRCLRSRSAR